MGIEQELNEFLIFFSLSFADIIGMSSNQLKTVGSTLKKTQQTKQVCRFHIPFFLSFAIFALI